MITFSLNPFERFPRSPRVLFLIYHFLFYAFYAILVAISCFLFLAPFILSRTRVLIDTCLVLIDLVSFHRVARGSQPQPTHISPLLFHSFYSTPTPVPIRLSYKTTPVLFLHSPHHNIHHTIQSFLFHAHTHHHTFSRPPALPFSRFPTPLENQKNTRSKYIWFLFSGVFNCLFSFRMFSAHISEAQLNFYVSFGALSTACFHDNMKFPTSSIIFAGR